MSRYSPWKSFENEVARGLKKQGWDAKRIWEKQFKERFGVDVIAEKEDNRLMIQCKYGKKPNLKKAWLEALQESVRSDLVIGIARWKGEYDTLAVIRWKDLLKLL